MNKFSGPLTLREVGYDQWELIDPLVFTSDTGIVVTVPAGFATDLASVPKVFRSIVNRFGYISSGAAIHDFLYRNHNTGVDSTLTRRQADDLLLEGIRNQAVVFNVPDSKRIDWAVYGGVRIGGASSWYTAEETRIWKEQSSSQDYLDQ